MKLQDGETYAKADGTEETVGGTCKDYPAWVWTIQGNWYERATGNAIRTSITGRRNGFDTYGHVVSQHHGLIRRVLDT